MRMRSVAAVAAVGLGALLLLPPLAAAGKSAPNLKALTNNINKAKKMTFYAQYTSYDGTSSQTSVTIAQAPPKSNFSSASGSVINNGKTTYYCQTGGNSGGTGSTGGTGNSGSATTTTTTSAVTCLASKGSNPLLGLENLFSPTVALSLFTQAKSGAIAKALGIKVSSYSATFAGQPSTCISVSIRGKSTKDCVTKQGILAYSGSSDSSSYFKLTRYSSKPPASLFALPSGATISTVPGGASLP